MKLIIQNNFSVGLLGYTCGFPFPIAPSKYSVDGGGRWIQAFLTWDVTCTYSQLRAFRHPTCCVSLSAFYSETIVECSRCCCGCQGVRTKCVNPRDSPPMLLFPHGDGEVVPYTAHVPDIGAMALETNWNIVEQHPNLQSIVQVFNLQYKSFNPYDNNINDTGVFWGNLFYNDILLQAGEDGNVQAELLLKKLKDPGMFTFKEGWTFPRRIYFHGDECVIPPLDRYPRISAHNYSNGFSLFLAYVLNVNIIRHRSEHCNGNGSHTSADPVIYHHKHHAVTRSDHDSVSDVPYAMPVHRFLWAGQEMHRFQHKVAWIAVCKPKAEGGLRNQCAAE
ncbi:hypothetical protein HHK36_030391 [Tetracentron sinense]|uniref:COBRA C-terminal domain-containing protein n=1 Tax=Tetracentron sinense TaxID=13715 RepID=A0A834YCS3_TETSI|nr:hypothetical protein HHK36_030391 [Tetracentron sinense]